MLASIDTPFTVNPHLYRDQGFDPERDFTPVIEKAHALGGFSGIAPKKAPPLDPSKLSPEQKKARIAELEALLRGN